MFNQESHHEQESNFETQERSRNGNGKNQTPNTSTFKEDVLGKQLAK